MDPAIRPKLQGVPKQLPIGLRSVYLGVGGVYGWGGMGSATTAYPVPGKQAVLQGQHGLRLAVFEDPMRSCNCAWSCGQSPHGLHGLQLEFLKKFILG